MLACLHACMPSCLHVVMQHAVMQHSVMQHAVTQQTKMLMHIMATDDFSGVMNFPGMPWCCSVNRRSVMRHIAMHAYVTMKMKNQA